MFFVQGLHYVFQASMPPHRGKRRAVLLRRPCQQVHLRETNCTERQKQVPDVLQENPGDQDCHDLPTGAFRLGGERLPHGLPNDGR